jgi:3-methylcrotonyl-CoA carboxylase alpha subunit
VTSAKLQVRFNETSATLVVQPDGRISIEDLSYTVESIEPGVYLVSDGSRRWTVAVAGPADERWISVDGDTYVVEIAAAGGSRKKTRAGGQDALMAPMPATVVKLLVEPGARVAEGDTLIVLEAMKMELTVRAPRDGVVGRILCHAGELVQPGIALLEMQP